MSNKKNNKKLDIVYTTDNLPDYEMEKRIEELLKEYGYERTASGYGFGERDIEFYKNRCCKVLTRF